MSLFLNPLARACNSAPIQYLQKNVFEPVVKHFYNQSYFTRSTSAAAAALRLTSYYTAEPRLKKISEIASAPTIHYLNVFTMIPYNLKFSNIRLVVEALEKDIIEDLIEAGESEENIESNKAALREQIKIKLEEAIRACPDRVNLGNEIQYKLRQIVVPFNLKGYRIMDLDSFDIRHLSFFDKLQNASFIFVDLASVPAMLNAFKLIDLGKWMTKLGQATGSDWLGRQNLDIWIRVGCVAGYGVKLTESVRRLHDEKNHLNEKQAKILKLDKLSAAVDVAFHTMYLFANAISRMTGIDSVVIRDLAEFSAHSVSSITTVRKPQKFN